MQSIELGFAVPQVIAHRLARMDPLELHRMGSEKVFAFSEAWLAMAAQAFLEQQRLALSLAQPLWFPWARIAARGVAPIHRRAVANARRLRRRRR